MAMKCKKCNGIIPDIMPLGEDRGDCKNHRKRKPDINFFKPTKIERECIWIGTGLSAFIIFLSIICMIILTSGG
jgi:hypothetical protein